LYLPAAERAVQPQPAKPRTTGV